MSALELSRARARASAVRVSLTNDSSGSRSRRRRRRRRGRGQLRCVRLERVPRRLERSVPRADGVRAAARLREEVVDAVAARVMRLVELAHVDGHRNGVTVLGALEALIEERLALDRREVAGLLVLFLEL